MERNRRTLNENGSGDGFVSRFQVRIKFVILIVKLDNSKLILLYRESIFIK